MSNLNDLIHTNAVIAYKQGVEREQERIIKLLEGYLEVTQLPGDYGIEINEEWDAGFQAALALIKGNKSEFLHRT